MLFGEERNLIFTFSPKKIFKKNLLTPGILLGVLFSQPISESIPVHTYSIVALDAETGELGVAVQSHWFSVGSLVPWAKAGVGAVATQSFVKVDYGPDGLKLMEGGMSAESALNKLVMEDEGEAVRQVAMIDVKGNVAAHTGSKCIYAAGHQIGNNYSVQANLMENETVWSVMAKAFENTEGDLADKMMASLYAAEGEGGDIRVDDHAEPLKELKRLIRVHRAYQHANKGDHYLEMEEIEKALVEYEKASEFYPENPELPYWSAVTLASKGNLDQALPIFREVFQKEPRLRILTPRLVNSGLLPDDPALIEAIIQIGSK